MVLKTRFQAAGIAVLGLAGCSREPLEISGIYPSLVMFNEEGECGTGAVDDLWRLGKPRGQGGPWMHSAVKKMEPSDPYLITGYDRKRLELSNEGSQLAKFTLEADVAREGKWVSVKEFVLKPKESVRHEFPDWSQAYWVRLISNQDTTGTAQLSYD